MPLLQRGLEDVKLIRIDRALHDVFAQAIGAGDEDDVAKARFGVQGKDDAAGGAIGAHHLHHADRLIDLEVVDAMVNPVGDGAVHEQAGKALPDRVEQPGFARDVQKSLMLAGKAGGGQVFGGGRAAHGQRHLFAIFSAQAGIGTHNFRDKIVRQRRAMNDFPRAPGAPRQVIDILHVQAIERFVQALPGVGLVQQITVGLCRDRKTVGHPHALRAQLADHLAQRSILAADQRDIGNADL